jgi:hypothetical protein
VSENDPDPYEPDEGQDTSVLGGEKVPDSGDPTDGGRHGEIGAVPSITSDEPDDGGPGYPVGGGRVEEQENAPPVGGPGGGA